MVDRPREFDHFCEGKRLHERLRAIADLVERDSANPKRVKQYLLWLIEGIDLDAKSQLRSSRRNSGESSEGDS